MRSLAAGAILVGIVSVIAALTLLPAVLGLLKDRVNALRIPFVGRRSEDGRRRGPVLGRDRARRPAPPGAEPDALRRGAPRARAARADDERRHERRFLAPGPLRLQAGVPRARAGLLDRHAGSGHGRRLERVEPGRRRPRSRACGRGSRAIRGSAEPRSSARPTARLPCSPSPFPATRRRARPSTPCASCGRRSRTRPSQAPTPRSSWAGRRRRTSTTSTP